MLANSNGATSLGALSLSNLTGGSRPSGITNESSALNLMNAASTSAGGGPMVGSLERIANGGGGGGGGGIGSAVMLGNPVGMVNSATSELLTGLGINQATIAYLNLLHQQQQQLVQYQTTVAQRQFCSVPANEQRNQKADRKRSYPCSFQWCVLCEKKVHSSKLPCHIRQCHVNKPMFQCPKCEFVSTYSKNNVKSHMVSLHNLAEEPISYMELYAGDVEEFMKICFPNVRGRGRPIRSASRQSPESPESTKSNESTESRRGSLSGPPTSNTDYVINKFTHSQRRMNSKQMAQSSSINGLLARACSKNAKINEKNLESSGTTSILDSVNGGSETESVMPAASMSSSQNTPNEKMDIDLVQNSDNKDTDQTVITAKRIPKLDPSVTNGLSLITSDKPLEMNNSCKYRPSSLRLGENVQPRYLKHNLKWEVLSDEQVLGTVYQGLNAQAVLEKIELGPFEALNGDVSLMTTEQLERVDKVRAQLSIATNDVIQAVNRIITKLDPSVLPVEHVDLIASIAPSSIDARRFKNFEHSNVVSSLGLSERLVLELSDIERVEEKLHVLSYIGHFNKRLNELIRQLNDVDCAARLLENSVDFHSLLQLVLIYGNFVIGDFNAQIVKGFRTSCLLDLCSFKLCTEPEITLLSLIASTISKSFPIVGKFREHLPIIDKAAKVNFMEVSRLIEQLERGFSRLSDELNRCSSVATGVNDIADHIERSLGEIRTLYSSCKDQVITMLRFFAEPIGDENWSPEPEKFFRTIALFCRNLQKASLDLHL